jgi:hypothetical protein
MLDGGLEVEVDVDGGGVEVVELLRFERRWF